jgi:hypothetical protein
MELEAGGNQVVSQLQAKFDLLFECAAGSQPTDGFEVTPDLVYFMIISVTTPGELFRCTPS